MSDLYWKVKNQSTYIKERSKMIVNVKINQQFWYINNFDLLIEIFDLLINSFDFKLPSIDLLIEIISKSIDFNQKQIKIISKSRSSTRICRWNRNCIVIVVRIWNLNLKTKLEIRIRIDDNELIRGPWLPKLTALPAKEGKKERKKK